MIKKFNVKRFLSFVDESASLLRSSLSSLSLCHGWRRWWNSRSNRVEVEETTKFNFKFKSTRTEHTLGLPLCERLHLNFNELISFQVELSFGLDFLSIRFRCLFRFRLGMKKDSVKMKFETRR